MRIRDLVVRGIRGLNRMTQIWENARLSLTPFPFRTRRWSSGSSKVVPSRVEDKARLWMQRKVVGRICADECHEKSRLTPKDETSLMFLPKMVSKEYVGRQRFDREWAAMMLSRNREQHWTLFLPKKITLRNWRYAVEVWIMNMEKGSCAACVKEWNKVQEWDWDLGDPLTLETRDRLLLSVF